MNNTLETIKDILTYWIQQVAEKTFYFVIIIIVAILFVYVSNPYGRYIDAWFIN